MAQHSNVGVHGRKRPAEDDPEEDQPLAKKFDRLHIDTVISHSSSCNNQEARLQASSGVSNSNDAMMLDDTKHTIYIHDLERELADDEPVGSSIMILPGLEDKLSVSRILVTDTKPPCSEIVLYREPTSLSIPREKDGVRRAIMESRERARLHRLRDGSPTSRSRARSQNPTNELADTGITVHCGVNLDNMDIDGESDGGLSKPFIP
ncbi:hypothetical protein P175DRAFT_0496898 [Aspergillus ochraceoroseus IBT 24754]|uniref:Uncharacterized protein n=3 Tax=Aspergillus subgen. Nidulantes TaxID=2720870 RepID=A0A0F8W3Z5_9EURO|nr:uncharacterized protein P175DRAFT_0496898 [Aspergillus ochraceoroseus IBT 24754]KKK12630.1 hypothetical protein ARAM_002257 [Aspergillus rambellii]KKK23793.1 hypothetical protein AOCH_000276 [Aspergillus ochraceoroseus]PTU23763.1 hypothetical protein P175DRAFT_0496898 [Aspergillus ochraceoroseus IBT 24754]